MKTKVIEFDTQAVGFEIAVKRFYFEGSFGVDCPKCGLRAIGDFITNKTDCSSSIGQKGCTAVAL